MLQLEYRQLSKDNSGDVAELQNVLEAAPDYYGRLQGAPADAEQAIRELETVPEGYCNRDKASYLICIGSAPVGFLDMLNGYPEKSIAYIGLLLLSESHQRCGLGQRATNFATEVGRSWGCSVVRLGVLETALQALSFWSRQGFVKLHTKRSSRIPAKIVVMERSLIDSRSPQDEI